MQCVVEGAGVSLILQGCGSIEFDTNEERLHASHRDPGELFDIDGGLIVSGSILTRVDCMQVAVVPGKSLTLQGVL